MGQLCSESWTHDSVRIEHIVRIAGTFRLLGLLVFDSNLSHYLAHGEVC